MPLIKEQPPRLPAQLALTRAMELGLIEIDTHGIIRRVRICRGSLRVLTLKEPRILGRPRADTDGFLSFHFRLDLNQYQVMNHVAVFSFFYRKPLRSEVVLHKNGYITDNDPTNLVCVKRSELAKFTTPRTSPPLTHGP